MNRRELKNKAAHHGGVAVRIMAFYVIMIATVVMQIIAVWLSSKGSLFPGTDALVDVVGTCAEIIAGLYGITLAGYTFFLSRIDALMATDTTLDYVVNSVKNRFKYLIWYITFNVLMTLFASIVLMYYPASEETVESFWFRLFCNEFVLFLGFSIGLILYYSIIVIQPNCLEKEAAKLKKKISRPIGPAGNVTEFIALYDKIEAHCNGMIPENVLSQIHENKGKRFEYTIELLCEQNPIYRPIIKDLTRIHRYYECVVNSSPMSVTQEMCICAKRVLAYLDKDENVIREYSVTKGIAEKIVEVIR